MTDDQQSPSALAEHVRRVVDTFPPLTAEQRDRLAALLRSPRQPAAHVRQLPARWPRRAPQPPRIAEADLPDPDEARARAQLSRRLRPNKFIRR